MARLFIKSQQKFPNCFYFYVFLLLLFSGNGCDITNYQKVLDKYDTDLMEERKNTTIFFTFKPEKSPEVNAQDPLIRNLYPSATSLPEYERFGTAAKEFSILQEELGRVGEAKIAESIPSEGIFVDVSTRQHSGSGVSKVLCVLSGIAIGYILPCYTDTFGILTKFTVYTQGRSTKSYYYYIIPQKFIWLGLLPFSWINYLVPGYEDAFRAVTHRFIYEARQEGVLW